MVDVNLGASVVNPHDAATEVLGLLGPCNHVTDGSGVLQSGSSFEEAGEQRSVSWRHAVCWWRGRRFWAMDVHKPAV